MHNQGPPDLEEWLRKAFKKVIPQKRTTLNDLLPPDQQKSSGFGSWLILPFLLVTGLGMSGIITVKPDEAVVIERLGVYQTTLPAGMHWTMPIVDRHISVSLDPQQVTASGLMMTHDHALVNVNISLNYSVTDPKVFALQSSDVNALVQAYLQAAIVNVMQQGNIADLLDKNNWVALATTLQNNFNLTVANYGIQVQGIMINSINVPDALSDQFNQKISAAQTQVNTMMSAAQQYKDSMVPLATAKATQMAQDANAERVAVIVAGRANVAQFNVLLPAYQKDPEVLAAYLPLAVSSAMQGSVSGTDVSSSGGSTTNNSSAEDAYLRWQSASQAPVSAGGQ